MMFFANQNCTTFNNPVLVLTLLHGWYFLQDPETAALIRKLDDRKREAVQRKQSARPLWLLFE